MKARLIIGTAVILAVLLAASALNLYFFYQDNQPLTEAELATLDHIYNPPITTRGPSTMGPMPNFAAITVSLDWSQVASCIVILSAVLSFTYWIVAKAIVMPMIQAAFTEYEKKLVHKDTFELLRRDVELIQDRLLIARPAKV